MQVGIILKPRAGHSLTAISLGPGLTEVVEFGGSPEPWTGCPVSQPKMADTTLLQFSECAHNYITIFLCGHWQSFLSSKNIYRVPHSPSRHV